MEYKIFANHAHVFPKEVRERATIEKLQEYMEICGIEQAVAFAPFPELVEEAGVDIDSNKWLADRIKNEPNIVGFGNINFAKKDLRSQVEAIHQYGLKGIKLHPAFQEFKIDSERAFEVYEKAEELGLFLSFHTGLHWHRLSDYQVILFDEIAYNFKNLRFSMEHIGGYSFFNEALAVMSNNMREGIQPRVYAGWTSISPGSDAGNGAWTISDQQLKDLIFQTGVERSIFGLDFPYNNTDKTIAAIERIKNLDISGEAKRGILGENLRAVLGV